MNNAIIRFFDVYFDLLNVRSTLDVCMTREIPNEVFEGRVNVVKSCLNEKVFIRQFANTNEEVGKKLEDMLNDLINEIYDPEAHIITKGEANIRVDRSQHLKILQYTLPLTELMKEILFRVYMDIKNHNLADERMLNIMLLDDRLYRAQAMEIALAGLISSTNEFNKCMSESKGQPTPQSNFIMQNEIVKFNEILRSLRDNVHVVDNNTLDRLDYVMEVTQCLQGRRELRPNMDMGKTIQSAMDKLHELRNQIGEVWNNTYASLLKDAQEALKEAQANKPAES